MTDLIVPLPQPSVPVRTGQTESARRRILLALLRSPTFDAGAMVLLFWIVCALFGSTIATHDPLAQTPDLLGSPSAAHWFGTDQLGRDVFSRVIVGARSVLSAAPLATALSLVLGTSIALVTGYYGGALDEIVGRFIEASFAVPGIIISMLMVSAFGYSSVAIVGVVAVFFSLIIARTLRAAVLVERDKDYVRAAKMRGDSNVYVMFMEILPNIAGPMVVEGTLRLGYSIFLIASLTFLGFGVQPPSPDWALQISDNYQLLLSGTDWWTVLFPALAIASIVVATNLIADSLGRVVK